MISRWCAATVPEVWTFLGQDGEPDEDFEVSPHDRCRFERHPAHGEAHRECCWGPRETESRDCTCECHIKDVPQESPASEPGRGNTPRPETTHKKKST